MSRTFMHRTDPVAWTLPITGKPTGMNDRFRRRDEEPVEETPSAVTTTEHTRVAPERPDETRFTRDEHTPRAATEPAGTGLAAGTLRTVRARQREEFGGIHWGAAFFGWLSAVGLAAILTAIVSAAGATLAFTEDTGGEETIGLAGGIAMLVVALIAYFAGGYVAGRMTRFDGARQGLGVWAIALGVIVVLAAAGAIFDAEYNVLERLDLPRIPVDEGDLAAGAGIAVLGGIIGSLIAALVGGKAGERYHRKIDRVAVDPHA
jgi:hypothetical protein